VTYPIPGNDDAIRAIGLYCDLISDAVLDGIQAEVEASGGDAGESEEAPVESLPKTAAEQPAAEKEDEVKAESATAAPVAEEAGEPTSAASQ